MDSIIQNLGYLVNTKIDLLHMVFLRDYRNYMNIRKLLFFFYPNQREMELIVGSSTYIYCLDADRHCNDAINFMN